MTLSGTCSKLNPLFEKGDLGGSVCSTSCQENGLRLEPAPMIRDGLSPETVSPPAPCSSLSNVLSGQQIHSSILTRAHGFVIAEERDPAVRLLAGGHHR